jgi:hypothetical protein
MRLMLSLGGVMDDFTKEFPGKSMMDFKELYEAFDNIFINSFN